MAIEIPDPPKDAIDVTSNSDVVLGGQDSDSDDGFQQNNDHLGYTPLSMDPSQQPASLSDSEDDEVDEDEICTEPAEPEAVTVSDFDKATAAEVSDVWNAPRAEKVNPMDSEQAAKILKAMEGFTLPASATPNWARGMSDEDWKKHVSDKILNSK